MQKFIINRSKWRCGDSSNYSNGSSEQKYSKGKGEVELKNDMGFMCCLGQISEQIDPEANILHKWEPCNVKYKSNNILVDNLENKVVNSDLSKKAILINDDSHINTIEREKKLKKLFKSYDVKLIFVNKTTKS